MAMAILEGKASCRLVVDELLPAAVMTCQTRVHSATKRCCVSIVLLRLMLESALAAIDNVGLQLRRR